MTEMSHMSGKIGMSGRISSKIISLRVLIPLLIVLAMLLLLVYVFKQEMRHEIENVYAGHQADQMDTAMHLQASIERDVRVGMQDRLQLDFSELSVRPEVRVAVLADGNNKVIASTRLSLVGKDLAQVAEQYSAQAWLTEFQPGDMAGMTIRQSVFTGSNAILISAPVRLDAPGSGLSQNKLGKLCIYTDVTLPLAPGLIDRLKAANRDFGVTLFVIEHNMRVIMNLADHVYCMSHGELLASGSPERIQNDPRVIDAYLGAQ